jgi:hypothetical protein
MNYLACQVFPENLGDAANIHDCMTKSTYMSIIGISHLEDDSWRQATLKIKFGGFGLIPVAQISHPSFLASWCQTIKELLCRYSTVSDLDKYLKVSESSTGSISSNVILSFKAVPALSKSTDENPDHQSLDDFIAYFRKLQQRLSSKITSDIVGDLIINSQSQRTARLRSLQGRGAGA